MDAGPAESSPITSIRRKRFRGSSFPGIGAQPVRVCGHPPSPAARGGPPCARPHQVSPPGITPRLTALPYRTDHSVSWVGYSNFRVAVHPDSGYTSTPVKGVSPALCAQRGRRSTPSYQCPDSTPSVTSRRAIHLPRNNSSARFAANAAAGRRHASTRTDVCNTAIAISSQLPEVIPGLVSAKHERTPTGLRHSRFLEDGPAAFPPSADNRIAFRSPLRVWVCVLTVVIPDDHKRASA